MNKLADYEPLSTEDFVRINWPETRHDTDLFQLLFDLQKFNPRLQEQKQTLYYLITPKEATHA